MERIFESTLDRTGLLSPGAEKSFRERQEAAAQRLVLFPQQTEAVQEEVQQRVEERFRALRKADAEFAEFHESRLDLQVPLAAVNGLIGTRVVRRIDDGVEDNRNSIDAYTAATDTHYQAAARTVFGTLCNPSGPYASLWQYAERATERYIAALAAMEGREWQMRGVAYLQEHNVAARVEKSWIFNGALTASVFVMKAIGARLTSPDQQLPDAPRLTEIARRSIDDLELIATTNRSFFGEVIGGRETYRAVIQRLRNEDPDMRTIDGRYVQWMKGITDFMSDPQAECPFAGRTTESPLFTGYASAQSALADGAWGKSGACSAQFTLRAATEGDDDLARKVFADMGVSIRKDGGFSSVRLQGALTARALGRTVFASQEGRAALLAAIDFVQSNQPGRS